MDRCGQFAADAVSAAQTPRVALGDFGKAKAVAVAIDATTGDVAGCVVGAGAGGGFVVAGAA